MFKIAKIRTKKFQQFLIRNEIHEIETKIDNFRFVNRRRFRNVTKINQSFDNEISASKKINFINYDSMQYQNISKKI